MTSHDYLSLGLALVPVYKGQKRPVGNEWQHNPITSSESLYQLSGKNVGLHHQASGTLILDIDDLEFAAKALAQINIDLHALLAADTPKIMSKNAAKPVYRLPDGLTPTIKQLKFVNHAQKHENITVFELRANGQDLLPPSLHPDGHTYTWINAPKHRNDIPLLPDALTHLYEHWTELELFMQQASPWFTPPQVKPHPSTVQGSDSLITRYNQQVSIHEALQSNGYALKGNKYLSPSSKTAIAGVSILHGALCYSHHASDVLNDGHAHDAFDVMRLLECNGSYQQAFEKARNVLGIPTPLPDKARTKEPVKRVRKANMVFMDNVQSEEVSFLWYPYLPLGKFSLLEGDPGVGKTFLALMLCSCVTRGAPLPVATDEGGIRMASPTLPPSSVIYLTAEDGLADTLKPRLEASQADTSKVISLDGYFEQINGETVKRSLSLMDVDIIEEALQETQAKLIIIDPIQGFMGGGVDMHRANEVRTILDPIGKLAEKYGCAIVGIRHLSKSSKTNAIHRGLGSVDFTAFARSQLLMGEHNGQKVLAHSKSSCAQSGKSLMFTVQDKQLVWLGSSDLSADELAAPYTPNHDSTETNTKLEEAKNFLKLLLDESPQSSKNIQAEARQNHIAPSTLKRAKQALDIQSTRVNPSGEARGQGEWYWHYPNQIVSISGTGELIIQEVSTTLALEKTLDPLEPLEETASQTQETRLNQEDHMIPLNDPQQTLSYTQNLQGDQEDHTNTFTDELAYDDIEYF